MKKNFKAVLFDFDGTLADTMQNNFIAWKKAFLNHEINIQPEDYFPLEGYNLKDVARIISEKYNLKNINFDEIVQLKNKFYLENHSFELYPNEIEFINYLKEKSIKLGIVSASPHDKLNKTVPKEFLDNFDIIISGDDCLNGKPDPEPYLNALKKLNLNADDCIVLENAPLGILSAKRAGIYCIALTTTLDKSFLNKADLIIDNYSELFLKI